MEGTDTGIETESWSGVETHKKQVPKSSYELSFVLVCSFESFLIPTLPQNGQHGEHGALAPILVE